MTLNRQPQFGNSATASGNGSGQISRNGMATALHGVRTRQAIRDAVDDPSFEIRSILPTRIHHELVWNAVPSFNAPLRAAEFRCAVLADTSLDRTRAVKGASQFVERDEPGPASNRVLRHHDAVVERSCSAGDIQRGRGVQHDRRR